VTVDKRVLLQGLCRCICWTLDIFEEEGGGENQERMEREGHGRMGGWGQKHECVGVWETRLTSRVKTSSAMTCVWVVVVVVMRAEAGEEWGEWRPKGWKDTTLPTPALAAAACVWVM
jgi:hypothetical protein